MPVQGEGGGGGEGGEGGKGGRRGRGGGGEGGEGGTFAIHRGARLHSGITHLHGRGSFR